MKIFKKLLWLLLIVLVVLGIVLGIGLKNIDSLVRAVVEQAGSGVTGTEVRLSQADIQIQEGRAALSGLRIQNPTGFSDAALLDVAGVAVDIDPASLTGDVLVIDEVILSGIDILAEQTSIAESTQTNIQALLDNIKQNTQPGAPSSGETSGEGDAEGEERKFAIKKLVFEESSLTVVTREWGDASLKLPAIKLSNLGSAEHGLTAEQLAQHVSEPVLQQVKEQMADQVRDMAKQRAKKEARDALEKKIDEKLSDEGKEALQQLKGLFR